ncbi:hypothetical protein H4R20_001675 [Coemansia guatemalensis]|uniref:PAS domain-containing protein n=1 Tax=Coemansia guatemalensis TaxID=2761395 RepID=A0A9W8HZ18_9FUNG|nr:hypothetical protein H4R20_001675 [Coemansia guatemalensis]
MVSSEELAVHTTPPRRQTYIGIHALDNAARVLYLSSGVRQGMGFEPSQLVSQCTLGFLADSYDIHDYLKIYKRDSNRGPMDEGENDDSDGNAYTWYVNLRSASGAPVLHRLTSFKCDSSVLVVCVAFPDLPFEAKHALEVQSLDGSMERRNITHPEETQIQRQRRLASQPGYRASRYTMRNSQPKAVFMLENPKVVCGEIFGPEYRVNGPHIAFVTGSVSNLIDADISDVMQYPFLKLVAPEDVMHVSKFFERLAESTDVLFENFALIKHPHIIEGDIFVCDEENPRVVVECLGAAVDDGVAILLRRLREVPAPKRDNLGNYIHSSIYPNGNGKDDLPSLFDMISSDPETTDLPGWSRV